METTSKNLKKLHFSLSGEHGGEAAEGKRKLRRPISLQKPMLVELNSRALPYRYHFQRKGNARATADILSQQAKRFSIQILRSRISAARIEIVLRTKSREEFQHFLRSVTAMLARKITGARKGHKFGKFWQTLAFSKFIRNAKAWQAILSEIAESREVQGAFSVPLRLRI